MSTHVYPEPFIVAQKVEEYVSSALHSAEHYSNSEPLDASGVYDLHRLAAEIYAMGWRDGRVVGSDIQHRAARRAKERAAAPSLPAADETGGASCPSRGFRE